MLADRMLEDLSDAALADANERNMCAAYRWFGSWPGGAVYEDGQALVSLSGVPHPILNGVFRARIAPETADQAIDAILARCRARSLPMFWWVGPGNGPPDLEAKLEARGLPYDGDVPGMAVDLRQLPNTNPVAAPPSLEIVRATSPADVEQIVGVLGVAFHFGDALVEATKAGFGGAPTTMPGAAWTHYLARVEGKPVAATSLLLAAGVAGIYSVGTLPEARGKGVATALVATALRDGRDAGYRAGVLQSSEMGYRVYQRLGFRQVCTFRHHVLEP